MTLVNKENTQESARTTVLQSDDIEQDIRHLVVQTLNEGKFSPEAIKQTLQDVLTGASKLAIEEASSNLQDFSDHDLKRALTDLQDLESLFLDTLSDVANKGQETTKATLTRLLEHLQNSGSSVGDSVTKILSALHHDLSKGGRLEKIQAAEMAKTASVSFIRMASGMLAGIADSLENKK
jgi:hypothetical protein